MHLLVACQRASSGCFRSDTRTALRAGSTTSMTPDVPGDEPSRSSHVVLSVVTPTFNRRERLDRVLRSLAGQDLDEPFEVVVVSDGSTDATDAYLASEGVP